MKPVSTSEFVASQDRAVPNMERVRDDVWTHPARHPNRMIRYTLSYLVRDAEGGFHVIDPGWDSDENFNEFVDDVAQLGGSLDDLRSIIVTHWHSDHMGMATRLQQSSTASIVMHRIERESIDRLAANRPERAANRKAELETWGVPDERRPELVEAIIHAAQMLPGAEILVEDDEFLDIPGHSLQVLRTPGHTLGHICLKDADARLLFTGDHVLPTINPGLGLSGLPAPEPFTGYIASLQSLEALDDYEVCPAHEFRFYGLRERCEVLIAHHANRAAEIADAVERIPDATVWDLARNVSWSAGWDRLKGFFLYSALMQTALYVEYLRGSCKDVGS